MTREGHQDKAVAEGRNDRAAQEQAAALLQGFLDRIEERRVSGWAWNESRPDDILEIDIVVDNRTLTTTRADRFRADLAESGKGNGCHAFEAVLDPPVPADRLPLLCARARSATDGTSIRLTHPVSGGGANPAQPNEWLRLLAMGRRAFQEDCKAVLREINASAAAHAAQLKAIEASIDGLRDTQMQITAQITTFEAFQARFDAVLKDAGQGAAAQTAASDRGLRTVVAVLALISLTSLTIGLYSVLS